MYHDQGPRVYILKRRMVKLIVPPATRPGEWSIARGRDAVSSRASGRASAFSISPVGGVAETPDAVLRVASLWSGSDGEPCGKLTTASDL